MGIVQHPDPSVNLRAPAPDAWAIRDVGTLAQARRLYDAGCRVSRHVLSRRCAQCGEWGDVLVAAPDDVADAIAFITVPGWRCNTCRRAETAHLVPTPRPLPASRAAGAAGNSGRSRRGKRNPGRRQLTQRERDIAKWQRQLDGAQATLDLITAGLMPSQLRDRMHSLIVDARHHLTRLGVDVQEVA